MFIDVDELIPIIAKHLLFLIFLFIIYYVRKKNIEFTVCE